MNVSSNIYDMHHIHELFLTLITWWFQHTDLFQNEVMPLLHRTLQLLFTKFLFIRGVAIHGFSWYLWIWPQILATWRNRTFHADQSHDYWPWRKWNCSQGWIQHSASSGGYVYNLEAPWHHTPTHFGDYQELLGEGMLMGVTGINGC